MKVATTAALIVLTASSAFAVTHTVTDLPTTFAPETWFQSDVRENGTASLVNLTGVGGNLENNQPLPTGAALLTTGAANGDKAEVGIGFDGGVVSDVLADASFSYSYYKSSVGDLNAFAAPMFKIAVSGDAPLSGDGFVQLIFEPTWNQTSPGSSQAVPTDDWRTVNIDFTNGLFWQTGGFGQSNSFGGPPLNTLEGWLSTFDADFANASIVGVSVGVGTFNQGQTGYFDNVVINSGDFSNTYDFEGEATAVVPEPATASLALIGLVGLATGLNRRRRV